MITRFISICLTILVVCLFSSHLIAQIIITSADLNAEYVPGTTSTIKTDTAVTTIDIGQLGATSWDFSFLISNPGLEINSTAVNPATTPYAGDFPGANLGTHSIFVIQGDTAITYTYLSLNGTFDFHGVVVEAEIFGSSTITTSTNIPQEPSATLPYTFNSTVDYSGEQTIITTLNDTVVNTINNTIVTHREVDAYGPMTMPGGQVYDALRVRIDEITITAGLPPPFNYDRHISYDFITTNGSFVNVPSDTTKPNVGVIANTASIAWAGPFVSDVKIEETIPGDYKLSQNYPNPFNPSTSIEYSIPEESFVELKVYDVLGNEVTTLVNDQRAAGVYQADFSGKGLASGLYIARITAGNYTSSIKMTLMK